MSPAADGGSDEIVDRARLVAEPVDRGEQGDGRGDLAGDGFRHFLAQIDGALLAHEAALVEAVVAQDFLEPLRIEFAGRRS